MPSKLTVPRTIKLTHLQVVALESPRFKNKTGIIVRFFLNKLISGELPPELENELNSLL